MQTLVYASVHDGSSWAGEPIRTVGRVAYQRFGPASGPGNVVFAGLDRAEGLSTPRMAVARIIPGIAAKIGRDPLKDQYYELRLSLAYKCLDSQRCRLLRLWITRD